MIAEPLHDGRHSRTLEDGREVVVKVRRHDAPPGFFLAEERGLAALRTTRTLRVPAVYECSDTHIVLEDLGRGRPRSADWETAGCGLARLHAQRAEHFGLDTQGWCGDSPQDNTPQADGHRFFAERRLLPQARRAHDAGLLSVADTTRVELLCLRLPALLPAAPPVLLHGDLWTGNLHPCATGELALIDGGAVHYGWAEADLAMLTLFGEPPQAFFRAYEQATGCAPSWRERAPVYNLYHLLNHLNLFGGAYLGGVRAVLARHA